MLEDIPDSRCTRVGSAEFWVLAPHLAVSEATFMRLRMSWVEIARAVPPGFELGDILKYYAAAEIDITDPSWIRDYVANIATMGRTPRRTLSGSH